MFTEMRGRVCTCLCRWTWTWVYLKAEKFVKLLLGGPPGATRGLPGCWQSRVRGSGCWWRERAQSVENHRAAHAQCTRTMHTHDACALQYVSSPLLGTSPKNENPSSAPDSTSGKGPTLTQVVRTEWVPPGAGTAASPLPHDPDVESELTPARLS